MAHTLTHRLISLAEAAETLSVSTRTVRRYVDGGHLDAVRLGSKTLRVTVASIERLLESGALARRDPQT